MGLFSKQKHYGEVYTFRTIGDKPHQEVDLQSLDKLLKIKNFNKVRFRNRYDSSNMSVTYAHRKNIESLIKKRPTYIWEGLEIQVFQTRNVKQLQAVSDLAREISTVVRHSFERNKERLSYKDLNSHFLSEEEEY